MTLPSIATDAAKQEMLTVADNLNDQVGAGTYVSFSNNTYTLQAGSGPLQQLADVLRVANEQLIEARACQFQVLTNDDAADFDNLIGYVQGAQTDIANLFADPLSHATQPHLQSLYNNLNGIQTATVDNTGSFTDAILSIGKRWSIQDHVFYQYSKAGEAELNDQLGQLGDALDSLSQVIDIVNKIELALSVNPVDSNNASLVNSDGTLQSIYYTSGSAALMLMTPEGSKNAAVYTYEAYNQLLSLQSNFATGSSVYNAIATVLNDLRAAGVSGKTSPTMTETITTWQSAPNPPTDTGSIWSSKFVSFWQNSSWRQDINNLQTTLSSQNDVQKQNLRQAMFIYQEFVKSAALVMDRVYDAVKSIAGHISR